MKRLLFFLFAFSLPILSFSQDEFSEPKPNYVLVESLDGSEMAGTLISEDSQQLVLQTINWGKVTILKSNIRSVRQLDENSYINGDFWFENPVYMRYAAGSSAYALKKGDIYYQNTYLFLQTMNFGITDHFSIAGGLELASPIFDRNAPEFYYIAPKLAYQVGKKVNLGVQAYIATGDLFDNFRNVTGLLCGLATFGTKDNNVTFGIGWGAALQTRYGFNSSSSFELGKRPIATFAAMARPGKRIALVSESWFYSDQQINYYDSFYSGPYTNNRIMKFGTTYGMRIMGERLAVDLGFINSLDIAQDIIVGYPYIQFMTKFGSKKH
jgi:hypothetical protein